MYTYVVQIRIANTSSVFSTRVDPNQLQNSWTPDNSPLSFPDWQSQPPSLHPFHLPSFFLFFSLPRLSLPVNLFQAPPFFFGKEQFQVHSPPWLPRIFFPYRDNSTPLEIRKGD
jgi:hypothetical protein